MLAPDGYRDFQQELLHQIMVSIIVFLGGEGLEIYNAGVGLPDLHCRVWCYLKLLLLLCTWSAMPSPLLFALAVIHRGSGNCLVGDLVSSSAVTLFSEVGTATHDWFKMSKGLTMSA